MPSEQINISLNYLARVKKQLAGWHMHRPFRNHKRCGAIPARTMHYSYKWNNTFRILPINGFR